MKSGRAINDPSIMSSFRVSVLKAISFSMSWVIMSALSWILERKVSWCPERLPKVSSFNSLSIPVRTVAGVLSLWLIDDRNASFCCSSLTRSVTSLSVMTMLEVFPAGSFSCVTMQLI